MALIAERLPESAPGRRVKLTPPDRGRHAWAGEDALLLGFPGTPDRRPWSAADAAEQQRIAVAAARGEGAPTGNWVLLMREADELVLRSDPWGSRPLFYRQSGPAASVSDEIWDLLEPGHAIDPVGAADFLLVGHGIGVRTAFAGVSAVPADSLLRFGASGLSTRVFRPPAPLKSGSSLSDATDALERELTKLLDPYSDIGKQLVGLSGGLDSRTILALAVERGLDVHAWTFVARPGTLEEELARRVATTLGVEHTVTSASPPDFLPRAAEFNRGVSGQVSLEHLHGFGAHREAPPDYTIAPSGVWGDGFCGGSFMPPEHIAAADVEAHHVRTLTGGRDLERVAVRLPGLPEWSERLRSFASDSFALLDRDLKQADLMLARNRITRFNMHAGSAARDRLEHFAPFLDQGLVRTCLGIDPRWRREWDAYRHTIIRRWPELGKIPWEKTGQPLRRYRERRAKLPAALRRSQAPRARSFTDLSIYERAFADLIETAARDLGPVLEEVGIDFRGLLADYPEGTAVGGKLRLRAATLQLSLEQARSPTPAAPAGR